MKKRYLSVLIICTLAATATAQDVGIGNADPKQKLDVSGGVKIGFTNDGHAGSIRWDSTDFQGYNGNIWKSFTDDEDWYVHDSAGHAYRISNAVLGSDSVGWFPGANRYFTIYDSTMHTTWWDTSKTSIEIIGGRPFSYSSNFHDNNAVGSIDFGSTDGYNINKVASIEGVAYSEIYGYSDLYPGGIVMKVRPNNFGFNPSMYNAFNISPQGHIGVGIDTPSIFGGAAKYLSIRPDKLLRDNGSWPPFIGGPAYTEYGSALELAGISVDDEHNLEYLLGRIDFANYVDNGANGYAASMDQNLGGRIEVKALTRYVSWHPGNGLYEPDGSLTSGYQKPETPSYMSFTINTGWGAYEAMRIDTTGHVGIGTAHPLTALDVIGGIRLGYTNLDTIYQGDSAYLGTMRWDTATHDFQGWDGSQWHSFTNDADSANELIDTLWLSSTDSLVIKEAGAEHSISLQSLRVDSLWKENTAGEIYSQQTIGIGTSDPWDNSLLHLSGNNNAHMYMSGYGGGGSPSPGIMTFRHRGSEDSTSFLKVGDRLFRMTMYGESSTTSSPNPGWGAEITATATQNFTSGYGTRLDFKTTTTGNYTLSTVLSIRDEKVGIGTTTPSQALDVVGALELGAATLPTTGAIQWNGSDFEGYNGSQWLSFTSTANDTDWTTGPTSMYSPTNLDVGIGTSTPFAKLQVDADNKYYATYIESDSDLPGGATGMLIEVDYDQLTAVSSSTYGIKSNVSTNGSYSGSSATAFQGYAVNNQSGTGTREAVGMHTSAYMGYPSTATSTEAYGIKAYAGLYAAKAYGGYFLASPSGPSWSQNAYGLYSEARAADTNYAAYFVANNTTGCTANYGVYANASGADSINWAGYFTGSDVYIDNQLAINTNTPTTDIHIEQSDATSSGSGGIRFGWSASDWKVYHSGVFLSFAHNGTRLAYIATGTGNYVTTSDARLKTDVQPLGKVLSKVKQLQPVSYHYTADQQQTPAMGFIAQDVDAVFPGMAKLSEDGYYGLAYDEFAVVSIKAIQELSQQAEADQAEIQNLKNELEELKALVNQLLHD